MQIKKINENKLEVTINIEDLTKKNIDINSFMSENIEHQSLFLDILNYANTKIGFNLKNCEIVIEEFLLPTKETFVLIITKIPNNLLFHISKKNYKKLKLNKSIWLKFNNFETLCTFTTLINNLNISSSLYILDEVYFMFFRFTHIKDLLKLSLIAREFADDVYNNNFLINENSEIIIKDFALQTFKKFFV